MSGKGYENGKYFEINRRGKLKEEERIDRKADRKLHGVKEHEHEHWGA